jgi:hypothetical protein
LETIDTIGDIISHHMSNDVIPELVQRIEKIESLVSTLIRGESVQNATSVSHEIEIARERLQDAIKVPRSEYLNRLKSGVRSYQNYTDSLILALRALRGDDSIEAPGAGIDPVPVSGSARAPKRKAVFHIPDPSWISAPPGFQVLKMAEAENNGTFQMPDSQMKLNFPSEEALTKVPPHPVLNPEEVFDTSDSGIGQIEPLARDGSPPKPPTSRFLESFPDDELNVISEMENDLNSGDVADASSAVEKSDYEEEAKSSEFNENEQVAPSGFIFQSQGVPGSAVIGECENQYPKFNGVTRLRH